MLAGQMKERLHFDSQKLPNGEDMTDEDKRKVFAQVQAKVLEQGQRPIIDKDGVVTPEANAKLEALRDKNPKEFSQGELIADWTHSGMKPEQLDDEVKQAAGLLSHPNDPRSVEQLGAILRTVWENGMGQDDAFINMVNAYQEKSDPFGNRMILQSITTSMDAPLAGQFGSLNITDSDGNELVHHAHF